MIHGRSTRGYRVIVRSSQPGRPARFAVFERTDYRRLCWVQVTPPLSAAALSDWPSRRTALTQVADHTVIAFLDQHIESMT
ncbi:hypothetical protein GCM10012275_42790 [Longimycelium tulufanense]|uniref:Uncharacterized protein n=1 Tax=Longimycelium tulufanense TaxID=907463 RepID=A0A8J3CAZ9_9PSEU|nr:hypothetical protein GCM10012275_42790 [Longimycelium tulufanense]